MGPSSAANISKMMERLGIDVGYGALPRFGLAFSSARRACNGCTARVSCTGWLEKPRGAAFGPPRFCANVDLLWELICDPSIGTRPEGDAADRLVE
jgi:hypothetical protein